MTCPRGYIQDSGDVHGVGYVHGKRTRNINECASLANSPRYKWAVKAFTYSPTAHINCKLLAHANPDSGQHGDFIFCQKLGIRYTAHFKLIV